jgi:hypothetical protein
LSFPPETRVYDHGQKAFYRVQSDGTMRELSPLGDDLASVVAQPGASWLGRYQWLLASLAMVLVILAAGHTWRKIRASRRRVS